MTDDIEMEFTKGWGKLRLKGKKNLVLICVACLIVGIMIGVNLPL